MNKPVVEPVTEADGLRRRLNTYTQWSSKKSSLQLATAGFIYTGVTDKVECQSCGIRLYNWQEDDDPLQEHKTCAPDCEFMLENFPNVQTPPKPAKNLTVKYPKFSDYETRLRSFDLWPLKCVAQKPDMMARSGFFYIGSADRARCFHCGVTLRDWDSDDYPPCAHRQWSENCTFAQQLDEEGMKKEIETSERDKEALDTALQCSTSFNSQVLVHCTSVPTDACERTLRTLSKTTISRTSPCSRSRTRSRSPSTSEPQHDSQILRQQPRLCNRQREDTKEYRIILSRGNKLKFEWRGDDNETDCVVVVERDDHTEE